MSTICDNCEQLHELQSEVDFYENCVIQLKQMLEHDKIIAEGRRLLKYENGRQQALTDAISIFEGEK
jgi:hypothetical protein